MELYAGERTPAPVAAAQALVDARAQRLPEEPVDLLEAAGRTLARDAVAGVDVPGFSRAAMDGYAVIAADTPGELRVAGESLPGRAAESRVVSGVCVRIATGAPMPEGADAIVPVERASLSGGLVRVAGPVEPGKHVARIGEDVARGDVVLRAGRRLRPQDLGVLSSLGFRTVACVRRPRVATLVTGDEILPPGSMPAGHAITDANYPMLAALVDRDGGAALPREAVADDRTAVEDALTRAAAAADCVLVTGGSGPGAGDHAPAVLAERGVLAIHGVAMRPGKPAGVGFLAGRPVFLMPGHPVACLCVYDFLAGRAVRKMAGRPPGWPYIALRMPLGAPIASKEGRTDYVRVRVENDRIWPLPGGAAVLTTTTRAQGFVVVPEDAESLAEGEPVTVHVY